MSTLDQIEKRAKDTKKASRIAISLIVIGIILVGYATSVLTAVGLFIFVWGNRIEASLQNKTFWKD